ncbi:MAG: hypothetical protein R3B96_24110 [Pirellulaceae bacterium]
MFCHSSQFRDSPTWTLLERPPVVAIDYVLGNHDFDPLLMEGRAS